MLWLLLLLWPLLFLQRALHREIQIVFLLLTRQAEIAIALFSVLFLPGVLLHELSHYLMALLLNVPIGRFSLIPQAMDDGRLQLGFIETAPTDFFRDALIGAAPLLAGGGFVAYAGLARLGLGSLWKALVSGSLEAFGAALGSLPDQPDFWLWFYLAFAVGSTMLPSESDRRAWRPVGLVLAGLLVISLLSGLGPWMLENLAAPLNSGLRTVDVVLGINALLHLVLLPPTWLLHRLLNRLTGFDAA